MSDFGNAGGDRPRTVRVTYVSADGQRRTVDMSEHDLRPTSFSVLAIDLGTETLPAPAVLARGTMEDLRAALAQFATIAADLGVETADDEEEAESDIE